MSIVQQKWLAGFASLVVFNAACGGAVPAATGTTSASAATTSGAGAGTTHGTTSGAGPTATGTTAGATTSGIGNTTSGATTGVASGATTGIASGTTSGATTGAASDTTGGASGTTGGSTTGIGSGTTNGATTGAASGTTGAASGTTSGATTAAAGTTSGATTAAASGTTGSGTTGAAAGTTSGAIGSTTGSTTGGGCPAPSAIATVGLGCATASAVACDSSSGQIDTCEASGSASCLVWTGPTSGGSGDCQSQSLSCTVQNSTPTCTCAPQPTNAKSVYVDSVQGADVGTVVPTGIQNPPVCRFGSLTHALAVVPGSGSVIAIAGTAAAPMVFTEQATGNTETFPLIVPSSVTLTTTDSSHTPADVVITFNDTSASNVLELSASTRVEGITLQNGGGKTSAPMVTCNTGTVTLDDDVLDATGSVAGTLREGLTITGSCTAILTNLTANNFSSEGIFMESTGTASITAGTLSGNGVGLLMDSGGATATGTTISNSGTDGVQVSAGTFSGVNLAISGSQGSGVDLATIGTVLLTDGTISGGAQNGIFMSAGTLSLQGTQVSGNAGAGLSMSGGATTLGVDALSVGAKIDSNTGSGIAVSGGQITSTDSDISGNGVDGVNVTGGSTLTFNGGTIGNDSPGVSAAGNAADGVFVSAPAATTVDLHGVRIAANGARGIELATNGVVSNAATVSLDGSSSASGSVITGNGATTNDANIRAGAGTLNITGTDSHPVLLTDAINGFGLNLLGATATLTGVDINANASDGISIDNVLAKQIGIFNCQVGLNGGNGITVHRSPLSGGANTLDINGGTLGGFGAASTGNTGVGLDILGDTGNVDGVVSGVTISHNTSTGAVISESGHTTSIALESNIIKYNGAGVGNTVAGGVSFPSAITLNAFTGNLIAGNGGDQITIGDNVSLTLNGAGGSCNSGGPNQIFCYHTGSVGLRLGGGLVTNAVDVSNNSWTDVPPVSGTDYSVSGSFLGTFTHAPSCGSAIGSACPGQ